MGIMHHGKIMIERSLSDLQGNISKIQVACQNGVPKLPDVYKRQLGDNRNNSEDSRYANIGNVKKDYIIGKAWFRVRL